MARKDKKALKLGNNMVEVAMDPVKFDTEDDANAALASAAKVINMKEKQMETEKKAKKAAATTTKDGRTKLPPLPKSAGKPKPLKDCRCGCGGQTRSVWVPGHDSRMRGWILRVERGYIKLSEIPDGERQAVAAELKVRAKVDGKSAAAGA
jgi:hypothetical protein